MGIRTSIFEKLWPRSYSLENEPDPPMFDWGDEPQCWQIMWRRPIDRGTRWTCFVAWTFRVVAHIPSPATYEDMGTYSSKEKAESVATEVEKRGGRCAMYTKAVDVCPPFEPIRPKTLQNPTAPPARTVLANSFELVKKSRLEILRQQFDEVFKRA